MVVRPPTGGVLLDGSSSPIRKRSTPELVPEILIHFNLDSPVLGPTFRSLVISDRFGLAKSLT